MLSDVEIREAIEKGSIILDPPPVDRDIQPASIDVHLGNRWGTLIEQGKIFKEFNSPSEVKYEESEVFYLSPGQCVLAQLAERLTLDASIVSRVEGKSSVGRRFVAIHVTAGFVDPGWDGHLTLEITNHSQIPYILRAGDPIGQLAFDRLAVASARPYGHSDLGSHYQNSETVRGAE